MNNKLVYKKAISVYGEVNQLRKAQEEFGELISAINQYLDCRIDISDLALEVADTEIMIEQVYMIMICNLHLPEVEIKKGGEVAIMRNMQDACGTLVSRVSDYIDSKDPAKMYQILARTVKLLAAMRMIIGTEIIEAAKAYKINRLAERLSNG